MGVEWKIIVIGNGAFVICVGPHNEEKVFENVDDIGPWIKERTKSIRERDSNKGSDEQ